MNAAVLAVAYVDLLQARVQGASKYGNGSETGVKRAAKHEFPEVWPIPSLQINEESHQVPADRQYKRG